jgi:putative ABC transport system permease protein
MTDLRLALRGLRKRPLLSLIIVATLAVGIGANAAMYSVVDSVLLEPLPYPDADELAWVSGRTPEGRRNTISAESYVDYRESATSFEDLAAHLTFREEYVMTSGDEPEVLVGTEASWNLFRTLGATAVVGRGFVPEDEEDSAPQVVVLSHGLWQRRFGGEREVVGRGIVLDGTPYEIVGVMSRVADVPSSADLWRPLRMSDPMAQGRGNNNFRVLGRLAEGVTLQQADAEMKGIATGIAERFPDTFQGWSVSVESLHSVVVGGVRGILWLLMGAVALVLLVTCANLAALLLARATGREGEVAVRMALGASRTDIMRQLLTETVVVAVVGGALGLLLAEGLVGALRTLGTGSLPRLGGVGLDGSALAFTVAISVITGVLFGLAPAVRAPRLALVDALKEGRGHRSGTGSQRLQGALVMGQVALSLVLLLGAGLLLRSFQELRRVELGFGPEGVLTAEVRLPAESYGEDRPPAIFWDGALERIQALPGVRSASVVSALPVLGGFGPWNYMWAEGQEPATPAERQGAARRLVAPRYFETMGIPLLRGRDFTSEDGGASPLVTVISRSAAETFFPDQDPVGQGLMLWDQRWEVVGVVGDVPLSDLGRELFPAVYLAIRQIPWATGATLAIRTETDPNALAPALRRAVREVEPDAPVEELATMASLISASLATDRLRTLLLASFAALALLLAALGIYGILAYFVSQRTHELGVHMALGADRGDLLRSVLRRGLLLAAVGITVGLVTGIGLSRLLQGMLFGVGPLDPPTFVAVPVILMGVALLASLVPAWRATRVNPVDSLRGE